MSQNDLLSELVGKFSDGIEEHIRRVQIPDPVEWIESQFYIPETRQDRKLRGRFQLQPYQKDALREALSTDENGNFKYSLIVWSDIKKSAKSTIAAAVNLYRAHWSDFGEFYVIANDLKQADSRVNYYLRRAIQLNPRLEKKYSRLGYRTTSPTGSFIEAIPIDPSGEAGSNADQITFSELWGSNEEAKKMMWCLDEETEVLTPFGWKRGVDLTQLDEIAVYDAGYLHWEHPAQLFNEKYKGVMHSYEHKNFGMVCTPEHRLYGRYSYRGDREGVNKYDRKGVMRSQELRESGYSYYHPVTTVSGLLDHTDSPEYVYISETKFHNEKIVPWKAWCTFLGVYLTEGSTSNFREKPTHVRISQLKDPHPDKYFRIQEILHECFGDWVKTNKRDGWKISNTELAAILSPLGKTWEKRVPRDVIESAPDVLEAFMEGIVLGDGHTLSSGSIQITCASKGLADDLQEVCLRLGWRTSVRSHDKKYWRLSVLKGSFNVSVHKDSWKEVEYRGRVWCPTVSTGLFLARRNGWVFVTGNSEMTLSPTKFGKSFRWVESYAGFQEESELLYGLYEMGVRQGRQMWKDRLYEVTEGDPTPLELFVNEEARMLCLWNTQPRCPWQTRAYYASEEKVLTPAQFARMHRNQWVSSEETFVPMEWWDNCARTESEFPKIEKNRTPMIIALDAAVSDDTFGLWMGCRHPENPGDILVIYAQRWKPVQGHKVNFVGTEEKPGPELVLRRLIREYNVIEVAYDPYQLHDMATRLKGEGLAWFREFPQTGDRLTADSQLRALIRERRIWHRGEPELREHVGNANAKVDNEDRRLRIVKRMEKLKIDLAVAMSMGCHEVLRLNL